MATYDVVFTYTPKGMVGEWANIIHVSATGNNCCNYGDRVPAVWFYANTYRLHIRDGQASNGNDGCDPTDQLVVDTATTVKLEIRENGLEVFYDDVSKCSGNRGQRTVHNNARVFMPDAWHAAADGIIDDFYIKNI